MAQATELAPIAPSEKHRPRHQIKRSLTELAAPGRRHHQAKDQEHPKQDGDTRERRHHHHRHHHGGSRKDRGDDRNSFLLAPTSSTGTPFFGRASADFPRSEGSSSYFGGSDLDPSRRTSLVVPAPGDPSYLVAIGDMQRKKSRTKAEWDAMQLQERADAMSRVAGLRDSLADLSAFSNDTTKTLDDSYYSVLERLGTLQQTVVALKELAGLTNELSHSFRRDARELVDEIETQVAPFDNLDEHQERITNLQGRISLGRDKTKGLGDRVDHVRDRVEGWEAADKMWRERTRKRLKVIWAVVVTTAIALLLLGLLGTHSDKVTASTAALTSTLASASSAVFTPRTTDIGPDTLGEALLAETDLHRRDAAVHSLVEEVREALRARSKEGKTVPDVLRALDEL
ncbi:hypothetical protein MN608_05002 [Microdochium nivale]|nr:hypothetical protein MN608_05002 [Microdochium nivale]